MLKDGLQYAPAWALLLFSSLAASSGSAAKPQLLSHSGAGEVGAGHSQVIRK